MPIVEVMLATAGLWKRRREVYFASRLRLQTSVQLLEYEDVGIFNMFA